MKVNLLQGTSTPTLTPMPGVHNSMQRTALRAAADTKRSADDALAETLLFVGTSLK